MRGPAAPLTAAPQLRHVTAHSCPRGVISRSQPPASGSIQCSGGIASKWVHLLRCSTFHPLPTLTLHACKLKGFEVLKLFKPMTTADGRNLEAAGGLQAAARSMADGSPGPQASLSSPPRPATAAGYLRGSTAPSYCLAATKTRRRRGRRPGPLLSWSSLLPDTAVQLVCPANPDAWWGSMSCALRWGRPPCLQHLLFWLRSMWPCNVGFTVSTVPHLGDLHSKLTTDRCWAATAP